MQRRLWEDVRRTAMLVYEPFAVCNKSRACNKPFAACVGRPPAISRPPPAISRPDSYKTLIKPQ